MTSRLATANTFVPTIVLLSWCNSSLVEVSGVRGVLLFAYLYSIVLENDQLSIQIPANITTVVRFTVTHFDGKYRCWSKGL